MKLIKLDTTTYILIFLLCLAGAYKQVIITAIIIIFHELGHLFWLLKFNVSITSIKIFPFGGIIKTNKLLNFDPKKELLISSAGIINQLLLFIIFFALFKKNIINNYSYEMFKSLNLGIIIFNIMPIYPLDGYNFFKNILYVFFPYLKVNQIFLYISILSLILFTMYSFTSKINSLFVITFLFVKLINLIKSKKYLENKFLLERNIYDLPYNKIKYDDDFQKNKLQLSVLHYFNYISEKEYLNKLYQGY